MLELVSSFSQLLDLVNVYLVGDDEIVCNLIKYRKFDVQYYCRDLKEPIGAMFSLKK